MGQDRWQDRLFVVLVVGSAALTVALVAVALFGLNNLSRRTMAAPGARTSDDEDTRNCDDGRARLQGA
jgi:hypothetical protein